jgi:hypothetical protein
MSRDQDIVIPLVHLGELRLYRDRQQPEKLWLLFRWPTAGSEKGYHHVSLTFCADDIPRLITTIDEAVKTREPRSYKTYTDHLVEFHPDRHPDDKKYEGAVEGRLWMGFHNLRRVTHESRQARRACLIGDEISRLIDELRQI